MLMVMARLMVLPTQTMTVGMTRLKQRTCQSMILIPMVNRIISIWTRTMTD